MPNNSIGFIGGGRITKIFLHAFRNKNISFEKVAVFDPNEQALSKLKNSFQNIETGSNNIDSHCQCDMVILAVHPPAMMDTLLRIKPFLKEDTTVISLAPKITIEKMRTTLDGFPSIARVNPSAPGIINHGINPVAFAPSMPESQRNCVMDLLHILGDALIVDESKLEAYAVISAMGSTYFWFQLEHLRIMGIQFGLNENEAKEALAKMLRGTIDTLFFSDLPTEEVMDLVPVKPIGEYEQTIKDFYSDKLNAIHEKIRP